MKWKGEFEIILKWASSSLKNRVKDTWSNL